MKQIFATALLLLPSICIAAGYGGAEGRNRLGERITIAADSDYKLYVVKGPRNGTWSEPYDMSAECPEFAKAMSGEGQRMFSCPAGHKFPLSGATYRIVVSRKYRPCDVEPYYDKTLGRLYVCIKGCGGKTMPNMFREEFWECS